MSISLRARAAIMVLAIALASVPTTAMAAQSRLVEIRVATANGQAVSGTDVALSILPSGFSGLSQTNISPLAHVRSDTRGHAAWSIELTSALVSQATENGGWLNVLAAAVDKNGVPGSPTFFSVYLGSEPSQLDEAARLGEPVVVVPTSGAAPLVDSCWNYHWELYSTSTQWTKIGELHASGDTPTAQLQYGTTADSSIDVKVQATPGGPWTLNGTFHVGNNTGSYSGTRQSSYFYREILSQFAYGTYRQYKDCYSGYHQFTGQQYVAAINWVGGYQPGNSVSYYDNNHTSTNLDFGPGGYWGRNQNSLAYFSGAVSVFGITLGSQSGSSTYVTYSYQFGYSNTHHYLYGLSQLPDVAPVIYADSRN